MLTWAMNHERTQSVFESQNAIMTAAELAGIDTAHITMAEIKNAVIEAGKQIIADSEKALPKNYRRVKYPVFASSLAISVATIMWHSLEQ